MKSHLLLQKHSIYNQYVKEALKRVLSHHHMAMTHMRLNKM